MPGSGMLSRVPGGNGSSAVQVVDGSAVSRPGRLERSGPGPFRPVAAQRRRRAMRAGRGRRGQLHRPVPDGRDRPAPPRHGRPRGSHPGRRRPGLRLPRHRPRFARPPGPARPDAEPGLGRRQRVHERHRRGPGLAQPGHLDPAAGRLRAGQRHPQRRRPYPGPGPSPAARRRAGRRRGHPAGHPRRPGPVAAPPGPSPRLHPGRVPHLGPGRVPGRPRPPRPGTPAGTRAAPQEGDQDRPVPGPGRRTARASRLHPARCRRRAQRRPRPLVGLHPGTARAALRKAVLAAKNGAPR